jgi:hypothetical protein
MARIKDTAKTSNKGEPGKKRHAKKPIKSRDDCTFFLILNNNIIVLKRVTRQAIRRMFWRAGVRKFSGALFPEVREMYGLLTANCIRYAVAQSNDPKQKKTISRKHADAALKNIGIHVIGKPEEKKKKKKNAEGEDEEKDKEKEKESKKKKKSSKEKKSDSSKKKKKEKSSKSKDDDTEMSDPAPTQATEENTETRGEEDEEESEK